MTQTTQQVKTQLALHYIENNAINERLEKMCAHIKMQCDDIEHVKQKRMSPEDYKRMRYILSEFNTEQLNHIADFITSFQI